MGQCGGGGGGGDAEEEPGRAHIDAWAAMITARARVVDRIERDLAPVGALPFDWYDILLALEEAEDGRLKMGDLADVALVSPSGLTRLVDRIEAAGYLRRERCAEDRRAVFAVLTDAGRAERERSWPMYRAAIGRRFARFLSENEAATLARLLGRMTRPEPDAP